MKKISLILICFLMLFFITSCDFLSLLDYISNSTSTSEKSSESSSEEESSEKDPSHEHEYEKEIISATCENDGYTKHQCECGYYFFDEITKKTEHNYVNAYVKNAMALTIRSL